MKRKTTGNDGSGPKTMGVAVTRPVYEGLRETAAVLGVSIASLADDVFSHFLRTDISGWAAKVQDVNVERRAVLARAFPPSEVAADPVIAVAQRILRDNAANSVENLSDIGDYLVRYLSGRLPRDEALHDLECTETDYCLDRETRTAEKDRSVKSR